MTSPALSPTPLRTALGQRPGDSTFEPHYTIAELARQWKLGRETIRLLIKDESGVLKIRLGRNKARTAYSIPESVARRVHNKLFHPQS
jgi:hypothetical protein